MSIGFLPCTTQGCDPYMQFSRTVHTWWKLCQGIQFEWLTFTQWEVGKIPNSTGRFFPSCFLFFSVYFGSFYTTYWGLILHFFPHWQRSEDGKLESQIVNVLQDIVEIIIQDVMVDGHKYVETVTGTLAYDFLKPIISTDLWYWFGSAFCRFLQTTQQYQVERGQKFVSIDTSFTHNKSVMEKVVLTIILM